jgi:hypothetical protein
VIDLLLFLTTGIPALAVAVAVAILMTPFPRRMTTVIVDGSLALPEPPPAPWSPGDTAFWLDPHLWDRTPEGGLCWMYLDAPVPENKRDKPLNEMTDQELMDVLRRASRSAYIPRRNLAVREAERIVASHLPMFGHLAPPETVNDAIALNERRPTIRHFECRAVALQQVASELLHYAEAEFG